MCKNKTCFHVGIALILGLLIGFGLHPVNGLTDLGVRVLAVTIPTLYLWLTVNTGWCALLFLGLLILTGAMTPTEVWAGSMGHFAVITMIVFSILNYALKETGLIDRAACWFVSRRIARGRPLVFLGLFFLSNLVIGMFVDNLSLAVIYVGLASALAEKIGMKKGDPFYACMFIGILWCNVVISIASPCLSRPVQLSARRQKKRSQFQAELRPFVRQVFLVLSDWLPAAQNLADAFFRLAARDHQLMPAARAAQAEIHAAAQHQPLLRAAGVLFFHDEDIVDLYVHGVSPFLPLPAYIGAGIGGIL